MRKPAVRAAYPPDMRPGDVWSDEENSVVVAAYLRLLEAELRGEAMVKARVNQEVRDLTGRGRGSVEYKFQNISAVLGEIRHPFVAGYKPAVKYQEALRQEVLKQLDLNPALVDLAFTAITRSAPEPDGDLQWQLIDPPDVELRRSGGG